MAPGGRVRGAGWIGRRRYERALEEAYVLLNWTYDHPESSQRYTARFSGPDPMDTNGEFSREGQREVRMAFCGSEDVPSRACGEQTNMAGFVLVGGWPAAGKTTLARALALELGFAYLSKDEIKEALMDTLGAPSTVEASRELGRAAVAATMRAAKGCQAAVLDSTWFPQSLPHVRALSGPFVEIRCRVPIDLVRQRYRDRVRDGRHLDHLRSDEELWGREVPPLGVGPLVEVDTSQPVETASLADEIRSAFGDWGRRGARA